MADHNGLAFTIFGRTMEPRSYDHLRAMNLLGVEIAIGRKNQSPVQTVMIVNDSRW